MPGPQRAAHSYFHFLRTPGGWGSIDRYWATMPRQSSTRKCDRVVGASGRGVFRGEEGDGGSGKGGNRGRGEGESGDQGAGERGDRRGRRRRAGEGTLRGDLGRGGGANRDIAGRARPSALGCLRRVGGLLGDQRQRARPRRPASRPSSGGTVALDRFVHSVGLLGGRARARRRALAALHVEYDPGARRRRRSPRTSHAP